MTHKINLEQLKNGYPFYPAIISEIERITVFSFFFKKCPDDRKFWRYFSEYALCSLKHGCRRLLKDKINYHG